MNWIRLLNPFHQPSEAEVLEGELLRHNREAEAAKAAIRSSRFALHMSNASMDAIAAWRKLDQCEDSKL
jgi:hypothetical protein